MTTKSFGILHWDGWGEDVTSLDCLSALYDELAISDAEHGDVAVTEETSWTISAHRDGRVVMSFLADPSVGARHMFPVSKARVLVLWRRLVAGDIDGLLAEPWKPGYVNPAERS